VGLVVRVVLAFVANAIALLIAATVVDGVSIDATSFVFAVVIFTLASVLLRPILTVVVARSLRPLLGVVGLVTTFAILLITDFLSDGLNIEGTTDWLLAVVIVWLAQVVYEIFDRRIQRIVMRRVRPGAA
jgi:putative membrane protein